LASGRVGGRTRSWWGWGWADEALTPEQVGNLAVAVAARFGVDSIDTRPPPLLTDLDLRPPRLTPPDGLAEICSIDAEDRASHTYGKSYRDVVRAFRGELPHPPDVVVF